MNYKQYLINLIGEQRAKTIIEEQTKEPTSCLRLNLLKTNQKQFELMFPNLTKHPFVEEAYYFNKEIHLFGKNPLQNAGMYYIQDASAMMVAHLLNIKEDDKVADLCAAPGGKATQVASYLNNSGLLLANDHNYKRCIVLSKNIERMGIANSLVTSEPTNKLANIFQGYFDKVILDVPCSGQGMFRKDKALKNDWNFKKVAPLVNLQKKLIMDGYKCLKKGGVMVYSTCTFTYEENEQIVQYLLDNTNASLIKIFDHPSFDRGINMEEAIRLYPDKFYGEGHFIALIKCNDEHDCNVNTYNKPAHKKDFLVYREFENKFLNTKLKGDVITMGEEMHLLPPNTPSLSGIKLLRNGLHLGNIANKKFKPNQALASFLKAKDAKNVINFLDSSIQVYDYLKGLTLTLKAKDGYNLIAVNDLSLGWSWYDGNVIKNLYPKGLRLF